jgi:ribokinase
VKQFPLTIFIGCVSKAIDIKDSLKYASAAASIAVSRLGAACSIPSFKEVEDFVEAFNDEP